MATQRNNKKKQEKSVTVIREGRILSLQFFKNNAGLLLIGIVAILALIGLRYSTQTKMQQIKKLTAELEIAESEKINSKAKYMSLIRESEMRDLIKNHNLNLSFQEQPPYELIKPQK